jgi:hypothetical protein
MLLERVEDATSEQSVASVILPLLKKLKKADELDKISSQLSTYLKSSERYDIFEFRQIVSANLNNE